MEVGLHPTLWESCPENVGTRPVLLIQRLSKAEKILARVLERVKITNMKMLERVFRAAQHGGSNENVGTRPVSYEAEIENVGTRPAGKWRIFSKNRKRYYASAGCPS